MSRWVRDAVGRASMRASLTGGAAVAVIARKQPKVTKLTYMPHEKPDQRIMLLEVEHEGVLIHVEVPDPLRFVNDVVDTWRWTDGYTP